MRKLPDKQSMLLGNIIYNVFHNVLNVKDMRCHVSSNSSPPLLFPSNNLLIWRRQSDIFFLGGSRARLGSEV